MVYRKNIFGWLHGLGAYMPRKMLILVYTSAVIGGLSWTLWQREAQQTALVAHVGESQQIVAELTQKAQELELLKQDDQVLINASLSAEIEHIQDTYRAGASLFEQRSELSGSTRAIDVALATFLSLLSNRKWEEAREQGTKVKAEIDKVIAASVPKVATEPITTAASNSLPGSGYTRQKVATSRGEFVVSMVIAPGARAIVETAGDSDCGDNCATKSLAEHVAASGGFAGINGSYFCPPDYAQCQGKVNSFDTLAVNGRSKAVLNAANNVYSTVPLVAMYGTNISFYDQTVQWGVDTSSGGAIANYPRLLRDGDVATTEENGKGTRGFVGMKDGAVVIGHIYAASFGDAAEVLKTVGVQNAMNLDGGGSAALFFEGGYKVGPGRSLPTAIVLVR